MTVEPSWRIVDGVCRDPSEYWKLRELEEAGSLPAHIRAWTAEHSDMFTVPDTRLQAITDADLAPVAALVSALYDLIESKPVAFNPFQWASRFRSRVLLLGASTEENKPVSKFAHGKRDHDELIEFGLLDPDQPTEYATHQTRSNALNKEENKT